MVCNGRTSKRYAASLQACHTRIFLKKKVLLNFFFHIFASFFLLTFIFYFCVCVALRVAALSVLVMAVMCIGMNGKGDSFMFFCA